MKPIFSIFVAVTLLLGSGAAEGARRTSTLMLPHLSCHLSSTDTSYQSDRGAGTGQSFTFLRKEAQAHHDES